MIKRVFWVLILLLFLVCMIIFGFQYHNASLQNTKFEEFNRHLEDAIDMNLIN